MSRFTSGLLASVFLVPSIAVAQDSTDEDVIIITASPLERSVLQVQLVKRSNLNPVFPLPVLVQVRLVRSFAAKAATVSAY